MIEFSESGFPHAYTARASDGCDWGIASQSHSFGDEKQRMGFDALLVTFCSIRGSWIGSFRNGNGQLSLITPASTAAACCVVARGAAYIVDVDAPPKHVIVPLEPIRHLRACREHDLLLLCDCQSITAYYGTLCRWRSRLFGDELTVVSIDERNAICRGYDPGVGTTQKRVDIRSGEVYQL